MWLVERVRDDGYEGETKTPLFVTSDETFAKDWAAAANIEIEAAMTLKKPTFLWRLEGMTKKGGGTYTRKDYEAELAEHLAEVRKIMVLDTYADEDVLEHLTNHDYEVTEVEVKNPPATV